MSIHGGSDGCCHMVNTLPVTIITTLVYYNNIDLGLDADAELHYKGTCQQLTNIGRVVLGTALALVPLC